MASTQSETRGQSFGERHQLYKTAVVTVGMLLAYCTYKGWHHPGEQLFLALFIISLASWPAIRWLQTQPNQFPAFQAFLLTCIPSYALPLISSHSTVLGYSNTVILKALSAVVLFQFMALFAFNRTNIHGKQSRFWTEELFTYDVSPWLPIGLWLNTGYVAVSRFSAIIPWGIDSIFRAVFFGIATACAFMLGREWGMGRLSEGKRFNILFALLLASILQMSSLYLIGAISSALVFFLAYISAGRRIPVFALALIFAVLSVLHNGKTAMREKYWANGAPPIQLSELPAFYSEWIENGLQPSVDEEGNETTRQLTDRASLLHIICLVVDATDNGLPFLSGETYGYVLPQFVPRFFWPGKPSGQIATSRLSIYFGLMDEESTLKTSVGFGVLSESYANFGYWGVGLLGLFIGWLNKIIVCWTRASPMISYGGLLMILLMAWSIQVELPMNSWVSSFYQASICVLGIPYVLKKLFN